MTLPASMLAMAIDRFGGPEEFRQVELEVPTPAPDEVLIRVAASSVNPVDYKMRQHGYDAPHTFPVVLGRDVAGHVAAVGDWVRAFRPDDAVHAFGRKSDFSRGSYAGFVAMPAGWVAPIPAGLDMLTAAAMPLAALTAYQALRTLTLRPGQTVLVHAGAGAVGSYAIQLAALSGARVITTASADSADLCRADGANIVIDHRAQDFVAACRAVVPNGVDAVLDLVGGETLLRSAEAARPGGRIATVLAAPPIEPFKSRGIRAERVQAQGSAGDLALLSHLTIGGRLRIRIADTLPLNRVADAHRRLEGGGVRGKLVLTVSDA